MAEKTEFVLGTNFGTPYGSGSQLIFFGHLPYTALEFKLRVVKLKSH
jgi:hypothetical protein